MNSSMQPLYTKIIFISITLVIVLGFHLILFASLFHMTEYPFTVLEKEFLIEAWLWQFIKKVYIVSLVFVWSIFASKLFHYLTISPHESKDNTHLATNQLDDISLEVGISTNTNQKVYIPEKGLYQNILITGTIGTGKTSSAMYPFVGQLLSKNIGMLILDVKGNFHEKVKEMAKKYHKKVTVIELRWKRQI